jgi:hypothetical protein
MLHRLENVYFLSGLNIAAFQPTVPVYQLIFPVYQLTFHIYQLTANIFYYTVKKVGAFPVPNRDVTGSGKTANLFFTVY